MFCSQCGSSLANGARFCSRCGQAVATDSANTQNSPPPALPARSSSTALFNPAGEPLPAFEKLAAAIFGALDQNVEPKRTNGLEVSKMKAYRTQSGQSTPPFYGEYVLPAYATAVGIQLVPNQPPQAPVLTWTGFYQFLLQKIQSDPDTTFIHIQRLSRAFNMSMTITRTDLPLHPLPQAQAKEAKFRSAIQDLAQRAQSGAGAGGGGGGGSSERLMMARMRLSMANSMANTMSQAGTSIMNSSSPNTYWYTTYN